MRRSLVAATLSSLVVSFTVAAVAARTPRPRTPWREAGWSEREAAAHLLDRLTFGARPGEVEDLVETGLDAWLERQLDAEQRSPELELRDADLPALSMSAADLARAYPPTPLLLRRMEREGVISREEIERIRAGEIPRAAALRSARDWMEREGLRPERELLAQTAAQKTLAARYSENQLEEVLVDFWFNHFTVSAADPQVRTWLLSYERDAIRPHVLGSFRELLGATARHPAMLLYLDNATSVAPGDSATTLDRRVARLRPGASRGFARKAAQRRRRPDASAPNRPRGLNENYARELLELHTLGVDGGYTQRDVIEVARAFSGWTMVPRARMAMGEAGQAAGRLDRVKRDGGELGFVVDGDFLFRADAHDAGAKTVLGHRLPANGGIEDGEAVLDLLASHRSTARHLARKLAIRFVADDPPAALVDRLASRFETTDGDLREVMRELVESPEFWSAEARRSKVKSPFEVAVSALRALDAELVDPLPLLDRVDAMGQRIYAAQAPAGYPDRADFWVNTGALVARMNFGLELAAGRVPGVRFDLGALVGGREPESAEAALELFGAALLPERDLGSTRGRLAPLLGDPQLAARTAAEVSGARGLALGPDPFDEEVGRAGRRSYARLGAGLFPRARPMAGPGKTPSPVEGVVGLLLGSPEFQLH